jgi:hypothetical protein
MNQILTTRPATRRLYLWLLAIALFPALSPAAQAQQSFVATCNVRHNRADFDGDCKTDISTFNRSTGDWNVLNSTNNQVPSTHWGQSGDIPTPGDYDGDGKTDHAIFRPASSSSLWAILRSSNGAAEYYTWGVSGDIPVARDYDGDGQEDIAVFAHPIATGTSSIAVTIL